jgi:hypothetical protein
MAVVVNAALAGPKTARYSNVYGALASLGRVGDLGATAPQGGISRAADILTKLGGADFTPLADYSNCWQMADGTSPCTADTQVGKIASTVGSWVATQDTAGYKPFLRDKFSYAPVVSAIGETWTFTGTPIAGRAGIRINASGEKYFASINTAGNFASTQDSAATSLTGDQTHIFCIAPDSWDNDVTQYFAGKYGAAGQRAFAFWINSSSRIVFATYSADGTTEIQHSTTVNSTSIFTERQKVYIRTILDVDNGASGHDVDFAYSTNYDPVTKIGTWVAIGTKVTTAGTAEIKDVTASVLLGALSTSFATNLVGKIYYYAAYANDTGEGPPAWEFNPQRDSVNFPANPYLDYDGTDDRLETNIAPGSYGAGYLCGGWTQMEVLGVQNAMFGSSNASAVRGVLNTVGTTGLTRLARFTGTTSSAAQSSVAVTPSVPFVADADYVVASAKSRLNGVAEGTDAASRDYRGSTQVALLGASNNAESGITAVAFFQGYMFSQIWLPSIPTAEQQAILRAYCASKAGVTL